VGLKIILEIIKKFINYQQILFFQFFISLGFWGFGAVRPAIAGAAITATGAVKVLAEVTSSMTGIEANYQYQLLFYVPALGSAEKIRLLGYSYALTSARKLR